MKRFTVTWTASAKARLASLWNDNPALRAEITLAADEIDRLLSIDPVHLGEACSSRSRQYVEVPLKVLFGVSEDDRLVRVIYVKFWDD